MDNGVIVIGYAAQLVNGIHREGSNMGMTSGRFAAETIIRAKGIGEFTKHTLSHYQNLISNSYITKDLKKYKNASSTLENNGAYFNHYMPAVNKSVSEMLTVDGISKSEKQQLIMKHMTNGRSKLTAALDIFKMLKEVK